MSWRSCARSWILVLVPLLMLGAHKGDVSIDQAVDALDVLLLDKAVRGEITLGGEAAAAGDVAPLGPTIGDGTLGPADLSVLLRVVSGEDVDGDGLPASFENQAGTLPFALDSDGNGIDDQDEDSDGDGLTNAAEYAAGLHPGNVDSDGDGVPDGFEGAQEPEQGVATNLEQAVSFLYEGPAALQTGVAAGTIEPLQVAVLRGRVLNDQGAGIPGVTISVHGRSEFGNTLTRADGAFDLAVNGGGTVTLNYAKTGLLAAQRQATVPWLDFVTLPDVVMKPLDPVASSVDLAAPGIQVAQSSVQSDVDGARKTTLLFPQGTAAQIVKDDGSLVPKTNLTVRLTEFTVGANGPAAMPAPLPPASAYTWAVGLDAEEAIELGSNEIQFSQPLPVYVENFLEVPIGKVVPVGLYSRRKAAWDPSEDGRVIKVLSEAAGIATLDVTGAGAATQTQLDELGITTAELQKIAELYEPDDELWRARITHFSIIDGNFPLAPPAGAKPWDQSNQTGKDDPQNEPPCEDGSVIECPQSTLRESVEIVGSPFRLSYSSDRVPGRAGARTITVPLSGDSVQGSLRRIDLEIQVAGQRFRQSFLPAPNQSFSYTWDGLDVYGRTVQGSATATVQISYAYDARYSLADPQPGVRTFSLFAPGAPTIPARNTYIEYYLRSEYRQVLGAWDQRGIGVGGWSLSPHHAYDPTGRVLYKGDGSRRKVRDTERVMGIAAGTGVSGYIGDGGPASEASIWPERLTVGPDGSVYFANPPDNGAVNRVIRRVRPDGIIERFAGRVTQTSPPTLGDGGPKLDATFAMARDLTFGPDGSLYVVEGQSFAPYGHRVRRIAPDGIVMTIIGNGSATSTGDGGPAAAATVDSPNAIAVAPDGTIYVTDRGPGSGLAAPRIRRISPDGIVTTWAGGGTSTAEGATATQSTMSGLSDILLEPDGSLLVLGNFSNGVRVRRIGVDGLVRTVAGGGAPPDGLGDGGPATDGNLSGAQFLALGSDGSILIGQGSSCASGDVCRVRRVDPAGTISTFAGSVGGSFAGVGGPALQATFGRIWGLATSIDGTLYVAARHQELTAFKSHVVSFAPPTPGFSSDEITIADRGGEELYVFDGEGRHLRTEHPLTRQVLLTFQYDAEGRLDSVTDADGNVTRVVRNGSSTPIAIRAPFGQETDLELDANGWLDTIRNPANDTHAFTYTDDGLVETHVSPIGGGSRVYTYHPDGRLATASDPAGGSKTLTPTPADAEPGKLAVEVETGLGRKTTYILERQPDLDEVRTTRLHTGAESHIETTTVRRPDATVTRTNPDGTTTTVVEEPDPHYGQMLPLLGSFEIETPSGRRYAGTWERLDVVVDPDTGERLGQRDVVQIEKQVGVREYEQTYATTIEAGQVTSRTVTTTTPADRTIADLLDAQGRLASRQVEGLEPVRFAYDATGRLEAIRQGTGAAERETIFSYDPVSGFLTSIEDPMDRLLTIDANDAAGRPTQETLPGSRVVGLGWDANGNLASLTPPGKPAHVFRHTPVDQESEYEPPAVGASPPWITESTWDGDRRLDLVERPDSTAIDLAYESPSGRLDTLTIPQGVIDLTYHPTTGQLESVTAPGGVALGLGWDGFLLESQTWSGAVAGSVGFGYESPGLRLSEETVNGAHMVSFQYDDDGLLDWAGDLDLTPHPSHGLLQDTTLGVVTTAYGYNVFGELASDTASISGSPLYANQYTVRDKLGRIRQKVETIQGATTTWDYAYDPAGRLDTVDRTPSGGSPVRVADYHYDLNGNRLCTNETAGSCPVAAVYDEQDRLVTDEAGRSYAYTEAGELRRVSQGGLHALYAYDPLGNLRSVCLQSSDPDTCTGGTEIAYEIDALGRRIGRRVGGTLQKGYLWSDGLRVAAELDGSGAVVSRFVYGTRPNVPEYMVKGGVTYRILTDHLGSVRLVVDASTGAVAQRIDYDAWGVPTFVTGPADFQPFGFAGGLYDPDTGLVRFGARDYQPRTGRWTSKDPIGFEGDSENVYEYVDSDPINLDDPAGLSSLVSTLSNVAASLPTLPSGFVNFSAGLGDALLGGLGGPLRGLTGAGSVVNECSGAYAAGGYAALAGGGARLAYAGLAKAGAAAASSAAGAHAFRNALKRVFRGGLFGNYRSFSYAQALAKYNGSAAAVQAAAGRTNAGINAYGAAVGAAGAAGASGCGCP